jgi:hypothetical protein
MIRVLVSILLFASPSLRAADKSMGMDARECTVRACRALWFDGDFKAASDYFNAALAQNPNDYEANLDFGMAYLTYARPIDYVAARKRIALAAAKENNVFNQYLLMLIADKTQHWLARDYYRVSLMDLLKERRDKDVQVRAPDMAFGRRQYLDMLASIPVMKLYVPGDGWLSRWATAKFAGVGLRNHVAWNPHSMALKVAAETGDGSDWNDDMALFLGPNDQDRIGKSGYELAESYWESFVFEMLNDQHRERTTWIWMRARSAKMTDVEYGALNRAFEQTTDLETADFYFEQWKPYCDKAGLPTNEALWSPRNPYPEEAVYKVFMGIDATYGN